MKRRPLVITPWLLLAGLPPARAQQRGGPPAATLTEADRADLARIEAYLNGLRTLRARFLQIAWNGAVAEGTAWIWRPGRMRFEYDPPEPLLLVADANQFLMYDRELRAADDPAGERHAARRAAAPEVRLSGDVTVTAGRAGAAASCASPLPHRFAGRGPTHARLQHRAAGAPPMGGGRRPAARDARRAVANRDRAALRGAAVPVQRPALLRTGRPSAPRKGAARADLRLSPTRLRRNPCNALGIHCRGALILTWAKSRNCSDSDESH
jgi:hypothetical protein